MKIVGVIFLFFLVVSCDKNANVVEYQEEIAKVLDKAKGYFDNEDYEKAIVYYNIALRENSNPKIQLRILQSKGLAFCYLDALDSSIITLSLADSLAKKQKNLEAIKEINLNLSSSYLSKGDYLSSIEKLKTCQKYSEALNDSLILGYVLLNQASIYSDKGAYDLASEYAFKSLRILDKFENNKYQTAATNLVGTINFELQDYKTAIEYYKKSLQDRKELDYAYGIAGSYNNLGNVYKAMASYDTAMLYFDSSLVIKDTLGIEVYSATTTSNIGEIYLGLKKLRKALEYYKSSFELRKINNNPKLLAISNIELAQTYLALNETEVAKQYIKNASVLANSVNSLAERESVYGLWKNYYKEQSNYDSSFYYAHLEEDLKDSIISIEKNNVVALLDIEYKTEQRLKTINFHKKKSNTRLILLFIAIWCIIVVLSVYFYKISKLKSRLLEISQEVTRLKKLDTEKMSHDFMGFMVEKYGITENRYKIWELIASGQTTEQMAEHLSVSKNTIKTQRTKLYEKLNLTSTRKNVDAAYKFLLEKYAFLED